MKISDNITLDFHHDVEKKETSAILTAYGEEVIATAKCSKEDHFDRKIGRKVALTRVLKKSPLSKEGRTKVWTVLKERNVKLAF